MDIERGVLARIDRKLLAGLGQNETYRMVRVPVTASKWSTWKRYCDSAGISMGRAIAAMIDRELMAVFSDSAGASSPVFAEQAEAELAKRQEQVARREMYATAVEGRSRAWDERLRRWEGELEAASSEPSSQRRCLVEPGRRRQGWGATSGARAVRNSSTSTAMACPVGSKPRSQIISCWRRLSLVCLSRGVWVLGWWTRRGRRGLLGLFGSGVALADTTGKSHPPVVGTRSL